MMKMNEGERLKDNTHKSGRGTFRCIMEIFDLAPVC